MQRHTWLQRRCSLDTRPQWPASPIAAAVTRDIGWATRHNTSSATPVALYYRRVSLCAPTPCALSPFTACIAVPGYHASGDARENSTRNNNSRRTPNRVPKFPFVESMSHGGWSSPVGLLCNLAAGWQSHAGTGRRRAEGRTGRGSSGWRKLWSTGKAVDTLLRGYVFSGPRSRWGDADFIFAAARELGIPVLIREENMNLTFVNSESAVALCAC